MGWRKLFYGLFSESLTHIRVSTQLKKAKVEHIKIDTELKKFQMFTTLVGRIVYWAYQQNVGLGFHDLIKACKPIVLGRLKCEKEKATEEIAFALGFLGAVEKPREKKQHIDVMKEAQKLANGEYLPYENEEDMEALS